ncbi:MAG TPA: nucleotide disphospho-sugar-binding domain-containing protein [Casimicrobiaceae bacterium]|nr:nucleotide disphospho-sugar-binding domain-containing protein [Casimicrobiaceae bacterium]
MLFIAEAVTLAHVGRAIRLASIADHEGFDVVLACDPRYRSLTSQLPFDVRDIRSVPSEAFLAALARGRPVYSARVLQDYVGDDLAMLEEVRPDAVVGDFRLSLSVSARKAGVRYINVTNAYWSPYARPDFKLPSLRWVRHMNTFMAERVFKLVRPIAFAVHAAPMNRVRRSHRMRPLPLDMRHAYVDGDMTLYADLPNAIPLVNAPAHHRFVGPVTWSPAVARPPWWDRVMAGEAPIYVSFGSSGPSTSPAMIIEAAASLKRPIVVATAGRRIEGLATVPDLYVADYVDGDAMASKACAVIGNGGSPTTHQALVHGVPVVGIAGNLDQYLNMSYVERFGAGVLIRSDRAAAAPIARALRRVVEEASFRERARAFADAACTLDTARTFARALRDAVATATQ